MDAVFSNPKKKPFRRKDRSHFWWQLVVRAFLENGRVVGNVDGPGFRFVRFLLKSTPLKTNMSPETQWLEDVFLTEIVPF